MKRARVARTIQKCPARGRRSTASASPKGNRGRRGCRMWPSDGQMHRCRRVPGPPAPSPPGAAHRGAIGSSTMGDGAPMAGGLNKTPICRYRDMARLEKSGERLDSPSVARVRSCLSSPICNEPRKRRAAFAIAREQMALPWRMCRAGASCDCRRETVRACSACHGLAPSDKAHMSAFHNTALDRLA